MTDTPGSALKALRDGLRGPIADVDSLIELFQACVSALGLEGAEQVGDLEVTRKAIHRYLPAIQIHLVTETLPNFIHALEARQLRLLELLFVPERSANTQRLKVSRWVALTTTLTLPPFLNASQIPALPAPSRQFLLDILSRTSSQYGIDQLYWAVWASVNGGGKSGAEQLMWEEATRSMVSVPAKCANASGKWKSEGWTGQLPANLEPKPFFDELVVKLEALMYELSTSAEHHDDCTDRIRVVIQRLAAVGLLSTNASRTSSRQPSFIQPLLPGFLAHLHPSANSPLPPYPGSFLPAVLLPLPASTLAALVETLLQHLPSRLSLTSLESDSPSEIVHRLVTVLQGLLGPATAEGEAWTAMLQCVSSPISHGDPLSIGAQLRARMVVGWIRTGGEAACHAFLNYVVKMWTDPKSIKFCLYSQQFHLTHLLLLSLSLLSPYSPSLVAISHRSEFLIAVQSFLGHPDPKIRRLGMLVAEILSSLTIREVSDAGTQNDEDEIAELKAGLDAQENGEERADRAPKAPRRLRFDSGMWDGEGEGKEECRWLRRCVGVNDLSAEISDDPTGNVWLFGWDTRSLESDHDQPRPTPDDARHRGRAQIKPVRPSTGPSIKPKPKPKVVMLDEDQQADPLEGYTPESPSSSRSPSPTPSYLEEVAADPTLALDSSQKKKATRPVYVQQLIALLKEREKPEHIEMGLKWGEGLVRAKRSFGTELSENAVNVALVTLALNDPFHLDDFDEKRQGLLNALVACAPKQVAPSLSEQYFNAQYSLQQKSVLLTSLAMGARELAGLSVPQPISTNRRIDFPTKTLPPALHQKYIGPNDITPGATFGHQLEDAIDGVRDLMLSKGAKRGEETVPELAREKRLHVGPSKSTKVAEVGTLADRQMASSSNPVTQPPVVPFKEVAAEYFIMPLINRFWQHFQDSAVRERRAVSTGDRYRGAGTGMVLSPVALEKLLMTLSLLLHAARFSPTFLSILAPEALELGVTIGSRHLPSPSNDPFLSVDDAGTRKGDEGSKTEAQVLAASLELVLVALDTSVELDKGRTLAMDKPELILAVGEWATGVFEVENKGGQVSAGQGGMREGRVKATAAGVVVKIAEIGEKWVAVGRMMR